jgi:transcriptional regulator with XRE-family HTH domain
MATDIFDGPKLKSFRKRARLTQMQVVTMAGVSETTICYLERGDRKPQSRTLQKLLNLYATRIDYWRQLAARLEGEVHVEGKVDPQASEWKRGSGLNHGSNLQTPVGSRPLPQPQGVPGLQRNL